jgi:hypothetical protein
MKKKCFGLFFMLIFFCFLLCGCEKTETEKETLVTKNNQDVLMGLDPLNFDDDVTVISFDGATMQVTAANFDADSIAEENREYGYYTADENTRFFTEDTQITFDEEGNEYDETTYAEIGYDGFIAYLESGYAVCHLWTADDGYCSDVIIYGAITIW